jgi:hypothetical protein
MPYMLYAFASASSAKFQPVCPRMLLAFSCDIIHYFWVVIQPQLQQTTLSDKVKICELPRTLWPDSDSSLFGSFEW